MAEKEFFIQAVQMVEADGAWNIPTVVLYSGEKILIGNAALANASDYKFVNEDFKIELGRYAPGVQSKRVHGPRGRHQGTSLLRSSSSRHWRPASVPFSLQLFRARWNVSDCVPASSPARY